MTVSPVPGDRHRTGQLVDGISRRSITALRGGASRALFVVPSGAGRRSAGDGWNAIPGSSGDPTHAVHRQTTLVQQLGDPGGELHQMRRCEVGVEVLARLPVLVKEERVRVLDALVQVVVDVPRFLTGRLDQRLERGPEVVALARAARM
jgi:hypothetical protein